MADRLINGVYIKETQKEIDARSLREEQAQLDKLKPSQDEVENAEFELRTLTLLTEVGAI